MATEEIKVKVTLEGDVAGQLKKATSSIAGSSKNIEGSLNGVKKAAVGMVAAFVSVQALKTAASFFNDAALAAGNLEEALSKQSVVFRGYEKEVKSMNKTLVDTFKLSTREAAQFTATIQDTLVPLGIARGKAADMSFEVVKLARDLGSFNNLPTDQVIRDIQSALVGNVETLRKYGVSLNETTIKQKAMEMGLIKNTKEAISPTTKAMVVMQATIEGSADAVGDFVRTGDSFNNQLATMKSKSEDLTAEIGIKSQGAVLLWNKALVKSLELIDDWASGVILLKEAIFGTKLENLNKELTGVNKTIKEVGLMYAFTTSEKKKYNAMSEDEKRDARIFQGFQLDEYTKAQTEALKALNIAKERKLELEKRIKKEEGGDDKSSGGVKVAKGKTSTKGTVDDKDFLDDLLKGVEAEQQAFEASKNVEFAILDERAEAQKFFREQKLTQDEIWYAAQIDQLNAFVESGSATELEAAQSRALINEEFAERNAETSRALEEKKQRGVQRTADIQEAAFQSSLNSASKFFGGIGSLLRNAAAENKNAAAAYKAVAIAQATIDTFAAANASYKAMAGIPYVGPALGIAAAAAAIVSGVANVAQISQQTFQQGGVVGGNSFSGDNLNVGVNSGEMILNKSHQQSLFNAIDSGSLGSSGGITVSDTIVINGNADEGAIAQIAQSREDQIEKMRELLLEMRGLGQLPMAA